MAGERNYLRVPPDSTGKRVRMIHTAQIFYTGKSIGQAPNYIFGIGERYQIDGFGFVHIHGVQIFDADTGVLEVHFPVSAVYDNTIPAVGAIIRSDDGNNYAIATVSSVVETYYNATNIMGYDNPEFGWNIKRNGAGAITFPGGDPELTAFGQLRVNDARLLAFYDFSRDKMADQFSNSVEGDAVIAAWDSATKSVKLGVGTTSGDRSTHTSNLFHSTTIGSSILYVFGSRVGDAGKANVVRNWGPFDAFDGFFFQLNGTTLRIMHRWTFNGTTGNMAVAQSDWNKDTLLGTSGATNPSGYTLNLETINLYWVDFQYIGGGRTRWGVFLNGERIVCHEMNHSNGEGMTSLTHPIGNPHRPLCWAIANTGVAGSGSEFYAYGGAVYTESAEEPMDSVSSYSANESYKVWGEPHRMPYWKTGQSRSGTTSVSSALKSSYNSATGNQYAFTLSPDQFYRDTNSNLTTIENHTIYQPVNLQVSGYHIANMSDAHLEVRLFAKCIMRGLNWEWDRNHPTVTVDTVGDHLAHGPEIGRFVVSGQGQLDFSQIYNSYQFGTVKNLSDQSFSRSLQQITEFDPSLAKYGTHAPVRIKIGAHPIFGSTIHLFDDKHPVIIRSATGNSDITDTFATHAIKTAEPGGYASSERVTNPSGWYYISMIDRDECWLYNSQNDIDDDRTVRILNVDTTTNVAIGDTITTTSHGTAMVAWVDTTLNKIYVVNRSLMAMDVGMATDTFTTTVGGTTITINSVSLNTGTQKDYWTCHKALMFDDLGIADGTAIVNPNLALYGNPPARQAWTFMIRWLTENDHSPHVLSAVGDGTTTVVTCHDSHHLYPGSPVTLGPLPGEAAIVGLDGNYVVTAVNSKTVFTIASTYNGTANPADETYSAQITGLTYNTISLDDEFDVGPDHMNAVSKFTIFWKEKNQ